MKVIDIHNHLYPKEWMDFFHGRTGPLTLSRTGPTTAVFYHRGKRLATVNREGQYDPARRVDDLDEYGIDVQIVSLTTPSVELIPKSKAVPWAKKINDYFAKMCEDYKGRFYAYATLPYQDVRESLKELKRADEELGVKGIMMFSNIQEKPIYSEELLPIYEAAEAYDMPVFVHPAPPVMSEAMKKIHLPLSLYGFIFDTTIAVTGLIFQGILERFPRLKIIHPYLGGVFPYMVGRVESSFKSHSKEYGFPLQGSPSEYYRRNVYIDTVSFHLPAVRCALDFMGPDHILIGTDYAHPDGGPEKACRFVEMLGLPDEDYEKILWKNATKLFKLSH